MTAAERTRQVVTKLFQDVVQGDLDGVLNAVAPDIEFELPGNRFNSVIANLGVWRGRDGVAEAFRLRTLEADVIEFEQRDMVVEDNRAFVINWQRIRHRRTGMTVDFEFSMVLTLNEDGLVRHWKAYFDSSPEVAMFRSDISERLIRSIREGRIDQVTKLLDDGADPSTREYESGLTALHIAAGLGRADIVTALLRAGADVHTTDSRAGGTALHKAVQNGDLDTVRTLVEAGAFVDAVAPTTGHTPLMDALWYKWPEVAGYLLDMNAGVNLSTHYGFSMQEHFEYELQVNALGKERLREADRLLKARVRRDEQLRSEQALMAAVSEGDLDRVRELLAGGAEVDARAPVVNGFNDAHTPLLVAARDGHAGIVSELLRAGADVNATEPTFGAVPLHKAVYNGNADITRRLVEWPEVDLDYQGATNGYTPLHDAVWHGYEDCARVLIDAGARVDLLGHDGKTPMDIAMDVFGSEHPIVRRVAGGAG